MAELARLRDENAALRAEVEALRQRLAQYERSEAAHPAQVTTALEAMHRQYPMQSSSDWIATYWVLTTLAGAPAAFTSFAEWVDGLRPGALPPCKVSLLYKADAVYQHPLFRWEEEALRSSTLRRRLSMARCLRRLLS